MADYTKEHKIIAEALEAARNATNAYLAEHGDRDCCGFAWVNIFGNRRLINAMKAINLGSSSYEGGWKVWNPSGAGTQALSAKEAGADAFAEVLRDAGYERVYAGSRMD